MRVHLHLRRGAWHPCVDRDGQTVVGAPVSEERVRILGLPGAEGVLAEERCWQIAGWWCDGRRVG